MGTLLLSAFCAWVLNVQSVEIKKDTIDKYVIDKQVIERFDGTQLEGKTISKYIIAYKNTGNVVEKTHVIQTNDHAVHATVGIMNGTRYEGLVIVDGKEVTSKELNNIVRAVEVVSVNMHKPGSKVAQSYGEKGEKGVMVIETKAGKAKNGIVYIVNGEKMEKKEFDKIPSNKIASISVDKKDGVSIIKITTKK